MLPAKHPLVSYILNSESHSKCPLYLLNNTLKKVYERLVVLGFKLLLKGSKRSDEKGLFSVL